jgi:hypothetical protein
LGAWTLSVSPTREKPPLAALSPSRTALNPTAPRPARDQWRVEKLFHSPFSPVKPQKCDFSPRHHVATIRNACATVCRSLTEKCETILRD